MARKKKTTDELLKELEFLRALVGEQKRARAHLEEIIKEMASDPAAGRVACGEVVERGQLPTTLEESLSKLKDAYEELQAAEEELRRQNEELACARLAAERERNRYQDLFDFAPDGYLVTDAGGVILEANRVAVTMLNVPRQELSGKRLVFFIASEQRVEFVSRLSEAKESGASEKWELRFQPRERDPFPAEITLAQAHSPSGEAGIFRWLIRDITDRKRAENKLEKENREIELANRILEVFVKEAGDDLYEKVLNILLEGMASRHGVFGYIDEEGDLICPTMSKLFDQCRMEEKCICYTPQQWKGLWGRALSERKTLYSNTPADVPTGHVPVRNNMATPILFQDNVIGLINLANKETDYTEEDREFIETVSTRIAPILYAQIQKEMREEERKRAEEALREAKETAERRAAELNAVFDSMADPVHVYDTEGTIVQTNTAVKQFYGMNPDGAKWDEQPNLYRKFLPRHLDGRLLKQDERPVVRALQGKPVRNELVLIRRPDGHETVHAIASSPIVVGEKITGAVSINRDITEIRRAELERETTIEFLRLVNESATIREVTRAVTTFLQGQSGCQAVGVRLKEGDDYPYFEARGFPQEFLLLEKSLCARSPSGELLRDGAGNPIIECMCGNVLCGRFDASKPFFTEHGSFWTNSTTRLLASTTEADRQGRTRNRCNSVGYESVALIPLRAGAERFGLLQLNDPRKGVFSLESIALWERLADYLAVALAKLRAEEALRESEDRYRRLSESLEETVKRKTAELVQAEHLAAIGQMVSTVAHEVRNPIHIIRTAVDALREAPHDEQERREILGEIEYGAKMLAFTISELLEYSRPLKLKFSFTTVKDVAEAALKLFAEKLKNINAHVELERADEEINVDAVKFIQVIANIISNAADAMPDGGTLTIRSRLKKRDEGKFLEISITDTGHGIEERHMEDIFKPFFTTKTRGTGLGLSLCKKILDAHDGTMSVKSKLGEGTTVELTLPIEK
jgi:PAS domain S-box-containing protein